MALNRLTAPVATTPTTFVQPSVDQITALIIEQGCGKYVSGSNIVSGAMLVAGGVVYISSGTTAISGTASAYVKITPSGATATASFVANLTGVSWNSAYKGYYDSSGNMYIFDEFSAFVNGMVSSLNRRQAGLDEINITGTYGIWNIASGDTVYVPPAGLYEIAISDYTMGVDLQYQIYTGAVWVGNGPAGGLHWFDGATRRFLNNDEDNAVNVFYRKLL